MRLKRFRFFALCIIVLFPAFLRAGERRSFNVSDYGAIADGKTATTKQLQAAIDACSAAGGGTVEVAAGAYVTGTLWMRSNVTLQIEAGATLLGSQNMEDFPEWSNKWEGPAVKPRRAAMICGEGLENVAITGRGTIDARGEIWWKLQRASKGVEVLRPLLFRLVDSRNVLVEGLTFRNSPMWTISPLACDNVTITGITIENPPDSPNTDGINPDSCSNVHISNCHINVGDDCITLKSGKETDGRKQLKATENVTIANCTLLRGHGGVVIGSEMSGCVRNVTISNCVFIGTDRGLRFKSRRGRGGVVEDVRASNLVMDGVLCPIAINLFYESGARGEKKVTDQSPFPVDEGTPRFRRLRFSNITARRIKYAAAYMLGLPEMYVEDVTCENCSFYLDPDAKEAGSADMAAGIPKLSRAGIIANRIDKLVLRNVDVSDQVGAGLLVNQSRDVILPDITFRTSQPTGPMIVLQDVEQVWLRGCRVPDGTASGVRIEGEHTSGVRMEGNDLSRAAKAVDIDGHVRPEAIIGQAGN